MQASLRSVRHSSQKSFVRPVQPRPLLGLRWRGRGSNGGVRCPWLQFALGT